MTKYAVAPMELPAVEIADSDEVFPVRRIYCVGRNYAEHAREMGSDPDRDPPFFFMKPNNTIIADGADFPYPSKSENVHFEIELVVVRPAVQSKAALTSRLQVPGWSVAE